MPTKVHNKYGCCSDTQNERRRFAQITIGECFMQSGRCLMKTEEIYVPRYNGDHKPMFQKVNAVRIGNCDGQEGRLSCIGDDTSVEYLPEAAIYTKG